MTTWGKITHQFAATHHYPDASGPEEFLKYPHRHVFHVTVWIEQFHNNRDIEYMAFKSWLQRNLLQDQNLGAKSCEMLAENIIARVRAEWCGKDGPGAPTRKIKCEVTEDGENGALVE